MERKIERKSVILLKVKKRIKMEMSNLINTKKLKNTGRTKNKEKNKLARQKLAIKHDVFNFNNCLIIRQLNVHRSQHNLNPLNFTFHATDRSKSSLFLCTIVQKGIITSILEAPA